MADSKKVMVVDDSSTMREVLHSLLVSEGYTIVGEYGSGRHLLEDVTKLQPDVICLDYHLPDANGIELLEQLHKQHPNIPVVMITGSESAELERQATDAGASGFIRKPFTQNDIIRDLRQAILTQNFLSVAASAQADQDSSPKQKTAVIADDSATMLQLLNAILSQANVDVVGQAENGEQAVELVQQHHPDIVCLDIEMPIMNGLEALQEIHKGKPETKVLMVTANADRECVVKAVSAGAVGYIIKPYQPDLIVESLKKHLA